MATLKIATRDRTHWLTDIAHVIHERNFHLPARPNGVDGDVLSFAFRDTPTPNVIHLADFHDETVGVVVAVRRRGSDGTETWVVPANACWLMGETGRTVDHF